MIVFNGCSLEVHNFGEKNYWLEKWFVMRYEIEHGLKEPTKYYSTSQVGRMSKKVRIMAARAIMEA